MDETDDGPAEPRFDESTGELELDYPASWVYKIIGADEELLRRAVLEVIEDEEVSLEVSKRSSGGKYVSLNVTVVVVSDEHRVGLYEALRKSEHVRIVL